VRSLIVLATESIRRYSPTLERYRFSTSSGGYNKYVIQVIKVKDRLLGNFRANSLLRIFVDSSTLLALSGGTSPNYNQMIVIPRNILPGTACMVDERYGPSDHTDSNEMVLTQSGLIDFFKSKNVNFVKILSQLPFEETAFDYDRRLRELFVKYEKKVAVVGIGNDLHTAGIFANSLAITSPKFVVSQVVNNEFPKRITMTLKTLKRFNAFIILTFGQEKKEALVRLLADKDGDINKYPALFFNKTAIKSFLITDVDL